ncbi:MAG: protein kinase [Planctomycetes bacterium]|nr:protein kinase [Planctomycetota bacterium]
MASAGEAAPGAAPPEGGERPRSEPPRASQPPTLGPADLALVRAVSEVFPEYRLSSRLGGGACGFVFIGRHMTLDRVVALKVLTPEDVIEDPAREERFIAEARCLARLDHPGVVRMLDFGERSSFLYFSMEYLDCPTIARHLRRGGALGVLRVLALARDLAGVLAYIHGRGLVHADLNPKNVLLPRGGEFGTAPDYPFLPPQPVVRLLDFGDAVASGSPGARPYTGEEAYAAPEVLSGAVLGPQADAWSLGQILQRLLKGAVVGPGGATGEESRILRDVGPLLARLLERDPAAREADLSRAARDLEGHIATLEVVRPPVAARVMAAVRGIFDRRAPVPSDSPTAPLAGAAVTPSALTSPAPRPAEPRSRRAAGAEVDVGEIIRAEKERLATKPPEAADGDEREIQGQGWFGKFQILTRVGRGGMGVVYRALDSVAHEEVALKVIKAAASSSAVFIDRLRHEAENARSLDHPNIVKVHEFGCVDGVHYLSMEFIEGETLRERVQREPLSLPDSVHVLKEVVRGLAYAHEQGIIHRDIKPSNVMLSSYKSRFGFLLDGESDLLVRITDFGLSRKAEEGRRAQGGDTFGTAKYLSPEQIRGEFVAGRSDIFSLGIAAYELLTGREPFQVSHSVGYLHCNVEEVELPAHMVNPVVPEGLSRVIARMMAKRVTDRYSAGALLADLTRLEGELFQS